jgi:hypothetical protein
MGRIDPPTRAQGPAAPGSVLAPIAASDDDYDALEAAGQLRPAAADWTTFASPPGPLSTAVTDALDDLREERY